MIKITFFDPNNKKNVSKYLNKTHSISKRSFAFLYIVSAQQTSNNS